MLHFVASNRNTCSAQIRIRELEDDILVRLTESSGDVTEDRALVEGLEESKKLSKEIAQQLADMKVRIRGWYKYGNLGWRRLNVREL